VTGRTCSFGNLVPMARGVLMSVSVVDLRNYLDANGDPICLICGRAILLNESVARLDDCMVHVRCMRDVQAAPQPCEPQP
jgi:hypothetical protein